MKYADPNEKKKGTEGGEAGEDTAGDGGENTGGEGGQKDDTED